MDGPTKGQMAEETGDIHILGVGIDDWTLARCREVQTGKKTDNRQTTNETQNKHEPEKNLMDHV